VLPVISCGSGLVWFCGGGSWVVVFWVVVFWVWGSGVSVVCGLVSVNWALVLVVRRVMIPSVIIVVIGFIVCVLFLWVSWAFLLFLCGSGYFKSLLEFVAPGRLLVGFFGGVLFGAGV